MSVVSYEQIREVIIERLGGPFDYATFHTDIREITSELDSVARKFKF